MRFTSLSIRNFRNISSADVDINAEDIVLTGINGQGKTNFLEALYLLCYGSSFRTNHIKECIKHGSSGFMLSAISENNGLNERISISFSDNKRKIMIDGKEITDRRSLIYSFPCIVFSHDDILFVKGEPEHRRKFFDQMMSLYSPLFFDSLRSYRAILMQRNAAIKQGNKEIISLYNKRTKILIIGSLNGSKNEYINCAKKYNINEDNLDFFNYSEIKNYGVEKLRYSSKYSDIICGSIPHKIKGMGDVSSFIAEIKNHPEEYPKLYNAVEKLSITKFKDALKKSRYFQKFYK